MVDMHFEQIAASKRQRLSRRDLLQVGGLGLMGVTLPRLLAAAQPTSDGIQPTADSCVIIFLNGGPSHLDMWDMKPGAPVEVRGANRRVLLQRKVGVAFGGILFQ